MKHNSIYFAIGWVKNVGIWYLTDSIRLTDTIDLTIHIMDRFESELFGCYIIYDFNNLKE